MGSDYSSYVVPSPPLVDYRPGADVALRIVSELVRLRWVDPNQESHAIRTASAADRRPRTEVSLTRLAQELPRALAATPSVVVKLHPVSQEEHWPQGARTAQGRSRMYEFEEQSRFAPEYCEAICLAWTELPSTVGGDGNELPCPACGAPLAEEGDPLSVGLIVPDTCPACSAPVLPAALTGEARNVMTGELRHEASPLFRFALCLTAVHNAMPRREPVAIDSKLHSMLAATTGVASWRALSSVR
jgi:hypothetical protein